MLDIRVSPKPIFLPLKSDPAARRFVFAYTITIENHSNEVVTLRTRFWRITDTDNAVQEVRGDGVIGEMPVLAPGASFTYTSAAVIATETGMMQGSYGMERENGELIDVIIPTFALIPPYALH